ncbi:MAG TPA: bifunctional nuclease family protein [Candidatus Deferrimicrobiaceae bacterium]|nr:bifunctional nuclease family protein [Candidatus Deferrimicrobiaceae bacterium]
MVKEMQVLGITIDPVTQSPIVILRDKENLNTLPIWIGVLEANAIAAGLENLQLPRPMTHDLFKNLLDQIGVKLLRVEVTDIRENTYYAALHMEVGGNPVMIDSRPSDAIAIAIRMEVPIMVRDAVIEKALRVDSGTSAEGEKDKWSELLEKMDPEDFSKYKM